MTEAQERWQFEHSLNRFKVPIIRRADGEYLHPDARIGWFMWQERAKLDGAIGVPKPLTLADLGTPLQTDPASD